MSAAYLQALLETRQRPCTTFVLHGCTRLTLCTSATWFYSTCPLPPCPCGSGLYYTQQCQPGARRCRLVYSHGPQPRHATACVIAWPCSGGRRPGPARYYSARQLHLLLPGEPTHGSNPVHGHVELRASGCRQHAVWLTVGHQRVEDLPHLRHQAPLSSLLHAAPAPAAAVGPTPRQHQLPGACLATATAIVPQCYPCYTHCARLYTTCARRARPARQPRCHAVVPEWVCTSILCSILCSALRKRALLCLISLNHLFSYNHNIHNIYIAPWPFRLLRNFQICL